MHMHGNFIGLHTFCHSRRFDSMQNCIYRIFCLPTELALKGNTYPSRKCAAQDPTHTHTRVCVCVCLKCWHRWFVQWCVYINGCMKCCCWNWWREHNRTGSRRKCHTSKHWHPMGNSRAQELSVALFALPKYHCCYGRIEPCHSLWVLVVLETA